MQAAEAAAKKKAAEKPTVNVGGRLHVDAATFNQDDQNKIDLGDYENGVMIRRAWLRRPGNRLRQCSTTEWQWSMEPDGKVKARDNYISINELPILGHVRVGYFKEPFGLERLISSNDITFMERSIGEFFTPDRHLGVMTFDWAEDENATWAIGAFTTSPDMKVQRRSSFDVDDHARHVAALVRRGDRGPRTAAHRASPTATATRGSTSISGKSAPPNATWRTSTTRP